MNVRPKFLSIIGLPFEASTTFLQGTVNGPEAILEDLKQMDTFDARLGYDPFQYVESHICFAHSPSLKDPGKQQELAYRAAKDVLEHQGFPLCLGGEHTVSLGPLRAVREKGEVGIVQLDAHADLRDTYLGDPMNHACVMRRAVELDCPLLSIGIRAISQEDHRVAQNEGIWVVDGWTARSSSSWYGLVQQLPSRLYLTIDMDAFDPEEVPGVGTPEPGGLRFEDAIGFLRYLFAERDILGADIVELMPGAHDRASIRAASRLLSVIVGLTFGKQETEK